MIEFTVISKLTLWAPNHPWNSRYSSGNYRRTYGQFSVYKGNDVGNKWGRVASTSFARIFT